MNPWPRRGRISTRSRPDACRCVCHRIRRRSSRLRRRCDRGRETHSLLFSPRARGHQAVIASPNHVLITRPDAGVKPAGEPRRGERCVHPTDVLGPLRRYQPFAEHPDGGVDREKTNRPALGVDDEVRPSSESHRLPCGDDRAATPQRSQQLLGQRHRRRNRKGDDFLSGDEVDDLCHSRSGAAVIASRAASSGSPGTSGRWQHSCTKRWSVRYSPATRSP